MPDRHTKILILGGGPAGAAAAMTLARLGHDPLLVSAPRRQAAIEGFSDRTMQALETLGFARALDATGPKVGRQAFWGGGEARVNEEFVVDRAPFDAALLADASEKGTEVIADRALRITRADGRWQVQMASSAVISADFLVEARGRAGAVELCDYLASIARFQGPEHRTIEASPATPEGDTPCSP